MQPDIDKMDLHQLRERKSELLAELAAVVARMLEVGKISAAEFTEELKDIDAVAWGDGKRLPDIPVMAEPGPNVHPEGEDAP